MLGDVDDIRNAVVARLTAAFAEEIDRRELTVLVEITVAGIHQRR